VSTLLVKLGLEREYELNLDIEKEEFIRLLHRTIDKDSFDLFGIFSKSTKKYKGFFDDKQFVIKNKRRLFESRFTYKTTGTYLNKKTPLQLKLITSVWSSFAQLFYILILIFYSILFITLLTTNNLEDLRLKLLFVLFLHMILMVGGPIFLLRKRVSQGIQSVKSDLIEIVKTKNRVLID